MLIRGINGDFNRLVRINTEYFPLSVWDSDTASLVEMDDCWQYLTVIVNIDLQVLFFSKKLIGSADGVGDCSTTLFVEGEEGSETLVILAIHYSWS